MKGLFTPMTAALPPCRRFTSVVIIGRLIYRRASGLQVMRPEQYIKAFVDRHVGGLQVGKFIVKL